MAGWEPLIALLSVMMNFDLLNVLVSIAPAYELSILSL